MRATETTGAEDTRDGRRAAGAIRQPVNGSVEETSPYDVNFQFMMPQAHWDGSPKTTTPSSLVFQLNALAPM